MIDIDHFKGYNDTYGHLAGDGCLHRVAHAMAENLKRAGDLLARYGGEEFVCLLPDCNATGGRTISERLRAKIESLHIDHKASPVSPWVTISLGTVTCYPTLDGAPESMVASADELLYRAKSKGRNRVCGEMG
jgi:diguanylate cyclase (GGDEF)-like protein